MAAIENLTAAIDKALPLIEKGKAEGEAQVKLDALEAEVQVQANRLDDATK